jgi:hypothetical protein
LRAPRDRLWGHDRGQRWRRCWSGQSAGGACALGRGRSPLADHLHVLTRAGRALDPSHPRRRGHPRVWTWQRGTRPSLSEYAHGRTS